MERALKDVCDLILRTCDYVTLHSCRDFEGKIKAKDL